MTLFLDIKNDEAQNWKLKLFLGISKEFRISVGPEKLRFGLSWGMPLRYCTPIETGNIEFHHGTCGGYKCQFFYFMSLERA